MVMQPFATGESAVYFSRCGGLWSYQLDLNQSTASPRLLALIVNPACPDDVGQYVRGLAVSARVAVAVTARVAPKAIFDDMNIVGIPKICGIRLGSRVDEIAKLKCADDAEPLSVTWSRGRFWLLTTTGSRGCVISVADSFAQPSERAPFFEWRPFERMRHGASDAIAGLIAPVCVAWARGVCIIDTDVRQVIWIDNDCVECDQLEDGDNVVAGPWGNAQIVSLERERARARLYELRKARRRRLVAEWHDPPFAEYLLGIGVGRNGTVLALDASEELFVGHLDSRTWYQINDNVSKTVVDHLRSAVYCAFDQRQQRRHPRSDQQPVQDE